MGLPPLGLLRSVRWGQGSWPPPVAMETGLSGSQRGGGGRGREEEIEARCGVRGKWEPPWAEAVTQGAWDFSRSLWPPGPVQVATTAAPARDGEQPAPPSSPSFPTRPTPGHHFPVGKSKSHLICKIPYICIQEAPEKSDASEDGALLTPLSALPVSTAQGSLCTPAGEQGPARAALGPEDPSLPRVKKSLTQLPVTASSHSQHVPLSGV